MYICNDVCMYVCMHAYNNILYIGGRRVFALGARNVVFMYVYNNILCIGGRRVFALGARTRLVYCSKLVYTHTYVQHIYTHICTAILNQQTKPYTLHSALFSHFLITF